MTELMGIREYARYRGCTHGAVSKAIKSQRLIQSIVYKGGKKKIRPLIADKEWEDNTYHKVDMTQEYDSSIDIEMIIKESIELLESICVDTIIKQLS